MVASVSIAPGSSTTTRSVSASGGTHEYNQDSVGKPVGHGCVRLGDDALEQLYERVHVGTPVYVY